MAGPFPSRRRSVLGAQGDETGDGEAVDELRVLRTVAGATALLAGGAVASPASAADVCITQKAKDALATCPGAASQQSSPRSRGDASSPPPPGST